MDPIAPSPCFAPGSGGGAPMFARGRARRACWRGSEAIFCAPCPTCVARTSPAGVHYRAQGNPTPAMPRSCWNWPTGNRPQGGCKRRRWQRSPLRLGRGESRAREGRAATRSLTVTDPRARASADRDRRTQPRAHRGVWTDPDSRRGEDLFCELAAAAAVASPHTAASHTAAHAAAAAATRAGDTAATFTGSRASHG